MEKQKKQTAKKALNEEMQKLIDAGLWDTLPESTKAMFRNHKVENVYKLPSNPDDISEGQDRDFVETAEILKANLRLARQNSREYLENQIQALQEKIQELQDRIGSSDNGKTAEELQAEEIVKNLIPKYEEQKKAILAKSGCDRVNSKYEVDYTL